MLLTKNNICVKMENIFYNMQNFLKNGYICRIGVKGCGIKGLMQQKRR